MEGGTSQSVAVLKKLSSTTLVLALSDFNKLFEVECDTFLVGISIVLIQENHPLAFFSEKLAKGRWKWMAYK